MRQPRPQNWSRTSAMELLADNYFRKKISIVDVYWVLHRSLILSIPPDFFFCVRIIQDS